MQESEYTTDGRDSHPSPAGTSRSDVSPHQLTAGRFLMHSVCHEPLLTSTCTPELVSDVGLGTLLQQLVHYELITS